MYVQCVCICVCVWLDGWMHVCLCVYIYICVYIYTHTYIHAHTHTEAHIVKWPGWYDMVLHSLIMLLLLLLLLPAFPPLLRNLFCSQPFPHPVSGQTNSKQNPWSVMILEPHALYKNQFIPKLKTVVKTSLNLYVCIIIHVYTIVKRRYLLKPHIVVQDNLTPRTKVPHFES